MKQIRLLIIVFFAATLTVFGAVRLRQILSADHAAPRITADEDTLYVSVKATEQDLLHGMQATDNLQGDVTDTLVVVSKSKFSVPGTQRISYAAFDDSNNVGTYTRTVTYVDYVSPHLSLSHPLRFSIGDSGYDVLDYISASDCLDGDISGQIKVSFGERAQVSDTLSRQIVSVQVTNSAGDTAALTLTASYEDYAAYAEASPSLSSYIIYTKTGVEPAYQMLLNGVWSAGKIQSFAAAGYNVETDVIIDSDSVNLDVPGEYTVTYRLFAPNGGQQRTATLIVIVED